ncbi:hypothetical protein [Streptomyces scopuliridis]|uniref:hypothetical protein n=1 Tax=Streptomyces scopuliridis TaxID=452529 RepID=UPI00368EDF95
MKCPSGVHDFPEEDETSAYCPEHGITLLWHGEPITDDDLAPRCLCGCQDEDEDERDPDRP